MVHAVGNPSRWKGGYGPTCWEGGVWGGLVWLGVTIEGLGMGFQMGRYRGCVDMVNISACVGGVQAGDGQWL